MTLFFLFLCLKAREPTLKIIGFKYRALTLSVCYKSPPPRIHTVCATDFTVGRENNRWGTLVKATINRPNWIYSVHVTDIEPIFTKSVPRNRFRGQQKDRTGFAWTDGPVTLARMFAHVGTTRNGSAV